MSCPRRSTCAETHIEYFPEDQRDYENKCAYGKNADNLHADIGAGGNGNRQSSPNAREQVGGDCPDNIVQLDFFKQQYGEGADDAADSADDDGPIVLRNIGSSRN